MADHPDHDPDRIHTQWMPEREQVAWQADSFFRFLQSIDDADELNCRRDALLVTYGSVEAGVKLITELQGAEAALALLDEYARAIRALKSDPKNRPAVALQ